MKLEPPIRTVKVSEETKRHTVADEIRNPTKLELPQITAVCVLIRNQDKFLAVARRNTTDEWGLPGGKIDGKETPREAAIRELKEETGLIVGEGSLQHIFLSNCGPGPDGKSFLVETFLVTSYAGEIVQGDAGPVAWVTKEALVTGPFGEYNTELLSKLG